jgi:tetratricopeptide (TPR) repeat protein
MPSHIFLQLGLWDDAVASNERAWKASRDWVKRRNASGAALDFHDLQWLQYMYLQQGRYALARSIIDTARAVLAGVDHRAPGHPDALFVATTLAFQYGAESGDWRPMQSTAEPPMPGPTASRRAQTFGMNASFQRAMAAALSGDTLSASKAAARFRAIADSAGPNVPTYSAIRAREIESVIATKRGDRARAIELLQEASAVEDKFPFVGPPSTFVAHEMLGGALVDAKLPAQAEVAYEQGLKLTPNRSAALLGLARARMARGDSVGAADAARKLLANWHAADADLAALQEARRISLASQR